jgi:hypothetical protein
VLLEETSPSEVHEVDAAPFRKRNG